MDIKSRIHEARRVIGKAGAFTSDFLTTIGSEGLADGTILIGLQMMLEARKRECKPPVGIAKVLLSHDKVERALRNTPHLGALSVLTKVRASRHDYVKIWCDTILDIKTMNPGLGLGSPASTVFGDSFGLPKSTTLAELMQAWTVALNYGHLFGTFATERALAYHLNENSGHRESLLRRLPQSSRDYVGQYFVSADYMRLFYGLALWRAHDTRGWIGKLLTGAVLTFLEMRKRQSSSGSHGRLETIFLKSRQIAMWDLHALLQISSSFPPPAADRAALHARLFPGERIAGVLRGYEDTRESVNLADLERMAFRDFFSGPQSARVVLAHLVAFKHWWNRRIAKSQRRRGSPSIVEISQDLFEQPKDWPTQIANEALALRHLTRITFDTEEAARTRWLSSVRTIRAHVIPSDSWLGANFLVSPGLDRQLHLDVFVSPLRHLQPAELNAIARAIAACLSPEESATNLPLADFAIKLLQETVCDEQNSPKAYLTPLSSNTDKDWLTLIASSHRFAQSEIKSLINRSPEEQRRTELAWFSEYSFDAEADVPVVVCLGDLIFKDSDGNDVAQVDTFWVEFGTQTLSFHFCECKTGKGGGSSQLRRLGGFIEGISEPAQLKEGHVKVWHAEVVLRATRNAS